MENAKHIVLILTENPNLQKIFDFLVQKKFSLSRKQIGIKFVTFILMFEMGVSLFWISLDKNFYIL